MAGSGVDASGCACGVGMDSNSDAINRVPTSDCELRVVRSPRTTWLDMVCSWSCAADSSGCTAGVNSRPPPFCRDKGRMWGGMATARAATTILRRLVPVFVYGSGGPCGRHAPSSIPTHPLSLPDDGAASVPPDGMDVSTGKLPVDDRAGTTA